MPGPVAGDLHVHSTASDGMLTPEEVVELAAQAGLSTVSLTDHETIAGAPQLRCAASRRGLQTVTGVEIACAAAPEELHLLCYLGHGDAGALGAMLDTLSQARRQRAREICARLRSAQVPLAADALDGVTQPGRPHIARAIVRAGGAKSTREAMRRFLLPGGVGYVQRPRPQVREVIDAAHQAGGLVVLAHPARYREAPVDELVELGLDGLEVWHPSADGRATRHWREVAARYDLLQTGGSDFHAMQESRPIGSCGMDREALATLRGRLSSVG